MNYPRVITIAATIEKKEDLKKAEWIWKTHSKGIAKHGIKINAIGFGNAFEELDKMEELKQNLEETRGINIWYNEERENKIKLLEAQVHELESQLAKPLLVV